VLERPHREPDAVQAEQPQARPSWTPSARHRFRQRVTVRALTPYLRPAAVGPCSPAYAKTINRYGTRTRHCARTFTSLSLIISSSQAVRTASPLSPPAKSILT